MKKGRVERKLAAILHADVVGYSRLTSQDEVGTHRTLFAYLDKISALVKNHDGKVINITGDAVLADFVSAVNAVECAVETQHHLKEQNSNLPDDRKLIFRIGLNLGDVMVARDDIYGDGVNVAARLEGLADPGGICISESIYDQVKNKLDLAFEYSGEHKVKNITEPVRTYRVVLDPDASRHFVPGKLAGHIKQRTIPLLAAVALLAGAGLTALWYLDPLSRTPGPDAALDKAGESGMPAKPSIAVLPFKNNSGDKKQEYFSDGITEDIITDLSKFHGLFIVSSHTVFTYKDSDKNVGDIGRDLGIRYVLTGSVQRTANKVRVNAQLVDADSGQSLWADRQVRDLTDLFSLQDEIVRNIVGTLAVKVDDAERQRAEKKGTKNLEAYDYVLRGRNLCAQTQRSANAEARKLIRQAIKKDPDYAPAYVALGLCYRDAFLWGWTGAPGKTLQKVHDLAEQALRLDDRNASAHTLLGYSYLKWRKYDLAARAFNRALELNPNDADTFDALGAVNLYEGKPDAAIDALETAYRFNPHLGASGLIHLGLAYYLQGRYADAIATFERTATRNPTLAVAQAGLAASYAEANRPEDAARAAAKVRRLNPFFDVESMGSAFQRPADAQRIREGLRKAGL